MIKFGTKGLIFKLEQNGVTDDSLNILIDFLKERKQRFVLNGQYSKRSNISAGAPQRSILGPLSFLIYINNLPDNLSSNPKLFADDTSLFSVGHDIKQSGINFNDDLEKVWNKLDLDIRNYVSLISFKSKVLKFICPSENSIFLCNIPKGIQLLTRLRLGLSHFRDHIFKHNFQDTLNPICNCGEDTETSCHYLLHCWLYTNERLALLNIIQGIDNSILELSHSHIVEVLVYGRKFLDISSNSNILNATIDFLLETKKFDERLF